MLHSSRQKKEIAHGKKIACMDTESIWGWGSPAGQLRARRRAEWISKSAGLRSGIKVLEVGCGTGLFTEMFAASGAHLVAVDISGDLLEKARTRGLPTERVHFIEKQFEDCLVDGPFDAVIGSSILHHLDLDVAIPRIYELLRPGGLMVFAEPNMLNPQILLQKNIPWLKRLLGDSPDETAFVRMLFRRLLMRAGFNEVEITPFDWLHPATPQTWTGVVGGIGSIFERIPGLREFAGSLLIRSARPHRSETNLRTAES
jgi:2-polyprenyl-3-methyl-5-hydroxy-6-metoxy-1,4-benzoquinol methylase